MNKLKKITALCISIAAAVPVLADSWVAYDKVIAVVNSEPIIESEINTRFEYHQNQQKSSSKDINYQRSRVLDDFIEEALIRETAYGESIVISDVRVLGHLEKVMSQYFMQKYPAMKGVDVMVPKLSKRLANMLDDKTNTKDDELDAKLNEFLSFIEKNQKMPFKEYFEEVRRQMRKDQVMSISIGITPPSEEDAQDWYKKNKKEVDKIGAEVWVKHILIKPRSGSFLDEKKANDQLTEIRNQILAGKSFDEMAKKYSEDPGSAAMGGELKWVWLAELDPYFAGFVSRMTRAGEISPVFKSGFGYHIVKYLGKRPVQYEKIKRMILYKLYSEKMAEQFDKWISERKKSSDIRIYMKEYIDKKKV